MSELLLLFTIGLPAAFAQQSGCRSLCWLDAARTGRCQVSRWYTSGVLERLQAGKIWGEIASETSACEGLDASGCGGRSSCSVDRRGQCSASRGWVAGKLAVSSWQGGAGLGAQRCGLLGQLMASEAKCLTFTTATACEAHNGTVPEDLCAWDLARQACGFPAASAVVLLRRDYQDELALLELRRQRCASVQSAATCTGYCQWEVGTNSSRCTLVSLEALLAVIDQDCPLRTLLDVHAGCEEGDAAVNGTACELRLRSDGLQQCVWFGGVCEANPMTVELDLLRQLGLLSSELETLLLDAYNKCSSLSPANCESGWPVGHCAPSLPEAAQ